MIKIDPAAESAFQDWRREAHRTVVHIPDTFVPGSHDPIEIDLPAGATVTQLTITSTDGFRSVTRRLTAHRTPAGTLLLPEFLEPRDIVTISWSEN